MRNKLFKNIGFLTLSQVANYLLPLVTIPYVTRIVGPENFGLIEFAQSTLLYLIVLVNFGFNRTATRQIAANPNNMVLVSRVFSEVVTAKLVLFIASFVIMIISIILVPKFWEHSFILLVGFPIVLGWAIYPSFLFEGLQKLEVNALADVLIKLLAAVLILTLITKRDQYYMVPLINGIMQVVFGGLILWYALIKVDGLKFLWPSKNEVMTQIGEAKYVFFSSFFTTLYNFSTIMFGAFLLSPIQLGIYAAASKLIYVANSFLYKPLLGAFYPYLAAKMAESLSAFKQVFSKGLLYLGIVSALGSIVIFVFARFIIQIVFGSSYLDGIDILKIMAPTLFIGSFIHMYLHQGILQLKKDKQYMILITIGGILSLILNYVFISKYQLTGAALVKIVVDVFLALVSGVYFYRQFTIRKLMG